jgi:hypothetical protein
VDSKTTAPLSTLIALRHAKSTDQTYADFLDAFLISKLGVHAVGAPPGTTGDFVSTSRHPIGLGQNRNFILAYADPAAFAARFGRRFNAEMWGETILDCVMHSSECEGVWVNSALAEISLIIDRPTIIPLMYNRKLTHPPVQRPWWQFW